MCGLPVLSPRVIVEAVAAEEGLLLLSMQIFGVNVVSHRWLAPSMHMLTSIRVVCTLLVRRLQVIVYVQTAPSGLQILLVLLLFIECFRFLDRLIRCTNC
jgi:hypothetical protein